MNKNIPYHLFICVILLLLCGCTAKPTIDFKNLHTYSSELDESFHKKLDPPYAAYFKTKNGAFLYVANRHEVGLETSTFQFRKDILDAFSPDIVILEGFEEKEGLSPIRITQHIQKYCLPKWNCCSENLYAAHLASQKKIKFIGAEPSDSEIFELLALQNYALKDVVFFYFVRSLPQYVMENIIKSADDVIAAFKQFISQYMDAGSYSYDDYEAWFQEKVGKLSIIDESTTAPIETGHYLQKLSSRINAIRDQHILKVIFQNIESHKKVVVAFGASHYPLQKDVLEQYLGRATYFRTAEDLKNHFAANESKQ